MGASRSGTYTPSTDEMGEENKVSCEGKKYAYFVCALKRLVVNHVRATLTETPP
jgi:hypothetical protein